MTRLHRSAKLAVAAMFAGSFALAASGIACSGAPSSSVPDAGAASDAGPPSGPYLSQLAVTRTGSAAAPSELVPGFAPAIHDYYVRCAAGTNALSVSMVPAAGYDAALRLPTSSGERELSLELHEDQAIVAVARKGAVSTEYWVRCLPHDFPELQWVEYPKTGTPTPGYYLLGTDRTLLSERAYAIVLDGHGVPVWYSRMPTAFRGVTNVDSLAAGTISFISGFVSQPEPYQIHELATRATTYVSVPSMDFHELRALPNGNHVVFATPNVSGVDLTGLALPLVDGGTQPLGVDSDITDCNIAEVDRTGAVVWSWVGTDHLDPVKDCTWPRQGTPTPKGGETIEPFHCNSIDVDPANGNLLVSARHMDSVFYIQRATGKILWKMGGSPYTRDGARYVHVGDPFFRQHDARLRGSFTSPCGHLQVSMFDDETEQPSPARAVLYDVDFGAGCSAAGSTGPAEATVAWEHRGSGSSDGLGSFRIFPDGASVIGWGAGNPGGLTFSELDGHGGTLIELGLNPTSGGTSYRAVKVPVTSLDLDVLRRATASP